LQNPEVGLQKTYFNSFDFTMWVCGCTRTAPLSNSICELKARLLDRAKYYCQNDLTVREFIMHSNTKSAQRTLSPCPVVGEPCKQGPQFIHGQKTGFCDLCQKNVHNLSALTPMQRGKLLGSGENICVRYVRMVPATVLLLAVAAADAADATKTMSQSDSEMHSPREMVSEQILGRLISVQGTVRLEPMFLESELDDADEPLNADYLSEEF